MMPYIITFLITAVVFTVIMFPLGYQYRRRIAEKEISSAEDEAKRIINEAIKSAESKKREALVEAKEEILRARNEYEREVKESRADLQKQERRLQQKEENLDRKTENMEKKEESLQTKLAQLEAAREEVETIKKTQLEVLERISGFTAEEAKHYLISQIEADVTHEAAMKVKEIETRYKEEADTMAREIIQRKAVYRVEEGSLAKLKSGFVNFGFNKFARSTKAFFTEDSCNGCGLCARNCPAGTISLMNGKPAWGRQCYQCLRCIHECPQKAIQYGKGTEKRGRYTIGRYLQDR